jgi:hypothetical protein
MPTEPDRLCVRPSIRIRLVPELIDGSAYREEKPDRRALGVRQNRIDEGIMMFGHPSSTPLGERLNVIMTRWHGLIQIACNPYRPELHYMRGPGPKWCAKHQGRIENGRL